MNGSAPPKGLIAVLLCNGLTTRHGLKPGAALWPGGLGIRWVSRTVTL